MVWDKTIIDRTEELSEWVSIMRRLEGRGIRMYAFANNHFGGNAPDTVQLFRQLWGRTKPANRQRPTKDTPRNLRFNF